MIEAKYFRDYRHNYMILQCGQEAAVRSYQYKILTSDKIREILRCSVRHINGTTYYYYDISSRTTLQNLYQSTKMSYGQVRDLLWQIRGICDRLAGFFMEESALVLLPEHIYYDLSTKRYIGLYYPDYQMAGTQAYEPLMNFLIEHIDAKDRQLAENMYRICEMAGEPHFLLEDALQILEEGTEERMEERSEEGMEGGPEDGSEELRRIRKAAPGPTDAFDFMEEMERPGTLPSSAGLQQEGKTTPKRGLFYPVFAGLSVLGIAGAAVVYGMYDLAWEEETALYGIMAVLAVCLLFGLWGTFRTNRKGRTAGKGTGTKDDAAGEMEESFEYGGSSYDGSCQKPEESPVEIGSVISKDMNFEVMSSEIASTRVRKTSPASNVSFHEQEMDHYSNTVFFDGSREAENKLYAMDRRNKRHIELRQFPCTVGKMAGCVDHVLADNSVSRIHARFDRQGDRVLLTDMNSTNGTYKNGLRMSPQETVEIEPGDEIRFGNLNYCYR